MRYLPLYAGHRGGEEGTYLCMLVTEEGRKVPTSVCWSQRKVPTSVCWS